MKYLFTLMTLFGCVAYSQATETPEHGYIPFLEQGKTWWYEITESCVDYDEVRTYTIDHHFGARIDGTAEFEGRDWMTCHIVDSDGKTVTARPITYLREENGKVYVTADHLRREYGESDFEWTPEDYWAYEDGEPIAPYPYIDIIWKYASFIHQIKIWGHRGQESRCDVDRNFPALVFDFSGDIGDSVNWPWYYGAYWHGYPEDTYAEPWTVEECGEDTAGTVPLRWWTLTNTVTDERCVMVEGVGVTRLGSGNLHAPEYSEDRLIGGLFFNPGQFVGDWESAFPWRGFYVPKLLGVERPDGTLLYGDESRPWSGVRSVSAAAHPADDTLYDLMGRRVERPVKGSVYVRQGRKVAF